MFLYVANYRHRTDAAPSIVAAIDLFADNRDRLFVDSRRVPGLDRREIGLARLIAGARLPAMRPEIIRRGGQRPLGGVGIADAVLQHRLRQELRLADFAVHGAARLGRQAPVAGAFRGHVGPEGRRRQAKASTAAAGFRHKNPKVFGTGCNGGYFRNENKVARTGPWRAVAETSMHAIMQTISFLSTLFVFAVGLCALFVAIIFVLDRLQTRDAILRNYPVIGHLRYILSSLGEFFRQYFFAMDRDELPFNRAERNWVDRASKNADSTVAFGSTRNLSEVGTPIFVNCPYPTLETHVEETPPYIIGRETPNPYTARSFFNISGMSFGALSAPAVLALSKGAKIAGCWMNTGEGGLRPIISKVARTSSFKSARRNIGVRHPDGSLDEERLRQLAAIPQIKMFEIKLSQGAKPGKGGILPGIKVTPEIAEIRGIPAGLIPTAPTGIPRSTAMKTSCNS